MLPPFHEYLTPGSLPHRRQGPRFLMSRPQPLGVLPTLWFWRELGTDRPLLNMLVGLLMGVLGASVSWALLAAGVGVPVGLLVTLSLPYLTLGLLERGLRWGVLRRRRALAHAVTRGELRPTAPADHASGERRMPAQCGASTGPRTPS